MRARDAIGAIVLTLMLAAGAYWLAVTPETVRAQGTGDWICSLDNIGATLTLCQRAAGTGYRLQITDIVAQSTTATGGQMSLQTGTGSDCGTGTTAFFPKATTTARVGYPPNTSAPTHLSFGTPLMVPAGKDLCVLGIATQTISVQIWGKVVGG
jgi:hypothetical protein